MFGLFGRRKQPAIPDYSTLQADVHSHLVPGIDDGAETMQTALAMVQGLMALGYSRAITTPHVYAALYPNSHDTILRGAAALQQAIVQQGWPFSVQAAAEYFLDDNFLQLLHSEPLLTFGDQYILFETSHQHQPANLVAVVQQIRGLGYRPVLAHPERYSWCWRRFALYDELRAMGLLFQCNINAFSGHYSPIVKKAAEYLASHNSIDFLGSDAHGMRHLDLMPRSLRHRAIQQLLAQNTLLNKTL